MSRFIRVAKSEVSGRGNYFPNLAVTYHVHVTDTKTGIARKTNTPYVAFGMEVDEIVIKPGDKTEDVKGLTLPQPGEERSWYLALEKDAAASDLHRFADMVSDTLDEDGVQGELERLEKENKNDREWQKATDEEKLLAAVIEFMVGGVQPLAGMRLKLVTYNRPTLKGNPFTIHEWARLSDA